MAEMALVVNGEINVDSTKYPHLRRALERGRAVMLAAGAAGAVNGTINNQEDDMATKRSKGGKVVKAKRQSTAKKDERDPRLPAPGSVITRDYKGKALEVKVLDQGFEFEGTQFPSLTALALKITGAKAISGPAFFKLTQPKAEAK